jgi:DNA end-binding protein Ku
VAIASVVVKTRQHLAAVVPREDVLVLDLLRYAAELRDPSRVRVPSAGARSLKITNREVTMAERLIEEMTEPWKPDRYHDEYRDELLAFIKKRSRVGKLAASPEPEEEPSPRPKRAEVIDIADLLQQSLAKAGPRGKREARHRHRRKKTA